MTQLSRRRSRRQTAGEEGDYHSTLIRRLGMCSGRQDWAVQIVVVVTATIVIVVIIAVVFVEARRGRGRGGERGRREEGERRSRRKCRRTQDAGYVPFTNLERILLSCDSNLQRTVLTYTSILSLPSPEEKKAEEEMEAEEAAEVEEAM